MANIDDSLRPTHSLTHNPLIHLPPLPPLVHHPHNPSLIPEYKLSFLIFSPHHKFSTVYFHHCQFWWECHIYHRVSQYSLGLEFHFGENSRIVGLCRGNAADGSTRTFLYRCLPHAARQLLTIMSCFRWLIYCTMWLLKTGGNDRKWRSIIIILFRSSMHTIDCM